MSGNLRKKFNLSEQAGLVGKCTEISRSRVNLERVATATAGIQQVARRLSVKSQFHADAHCAVDDTEIGGDQRIVDELGRLSSADAAQMDDEIGEGFEDRPGRFNVLGMSARHDGQRSSLRRRRSSAHRRLDECEAMRNACLTTD